jgi:2-(1,2-epoxy-1,2-dihydrophenyl)acetyl-CoA isomerase
MAVETDRAEAGGYHGFDVTVEAGVLTITFNRPEAGNAIASAAVPQLARILSETAHEVDARVVLIQAEGPSFCVGGDVKGFATTVDKSGAERRAEYFARMDRASEQIEALIALPCPLIVSCQGAVAGAAVSYPLAADIVLAEPGTRFVFPHQRLALPPDGGLTYFLPRVVGARKAAELTLTAATIDAVEAHRIGIVSRIVSADLLQEEAGKISSRIAAAPRNAVRRTRNLLRHSLERTPSAQLAAERDAVADSVAEEDFVEGVKAFMEKRQPVFPSGRSS